MRSLLDANVLIALIDADHTLHERAHEWLDANTRHGWASCALTENAVVRIMSNPNYFSSVRHSPKDLIDRLRTFVEHVDHHFWPDEISFRDPKIFAADHIHGPKQLTDLYLLALATKNKGRLVTFDEKIPLSAVIGAKTENICIP